MPLERVRFPIICCESLSCLDIRVCEEIEKEEPLLSIKSYQPHRKRDRRAKWMEKVVETAYIDNQRIVKWDADGESVFHIVWHGISLLFDQCVCILSQHRSHVFNPYAVKNVERGWNDTIQRDIEKTGRQMIWEWHATWGSGWWQHSLTRLLLKNHIVQI